MYRKPLTYLATYAQDIPTGLTDPQPVRRVLFEK